MNDKFISELGLSDRVNSGKIGIGTGFYNGDEVEGEVTAYRDFSIWSVGDDSTSQISNPEQSKTTAPQSSSTVSFEGTTAAFEKNGENYYIRVINASKKVDQLIGPVSKYGEIMISPSGKCIGYYFQGGVFYARLGDTILTHLGDVKNFETVDSYHRNPEMDNWAISVNAWGNNPMGYFELPYSECH